MVGSNPYSEPKDYWGSLAHRVLWRRKPTQVSDVSWESDLHIRWYQDGQLNVTESCLDRHLPHHADRVAYYWEPDDPKDTARQVTYGELHELVCRFANVLKAEGVKKGDRVTIYMPMIPEAVVAILATARIGAVHSVVFGGFSPESISDRINDCESDFVITADEGKRAGKQIPLKENVDIAIKKAPRVKRVFVFKHTGTKISWTEGRDVWVTEAMQSASSHCDPEIVSAEDPLFILYTSGSTNRPKGLLHTCGGYLVWASFTHEWVFDYRPEDIYWCTADVGWITGHSYIVYGPLSNAASSVIFEGVPSFPTASRFWEVVDKYKVSIFYTAPTALRALMREGDDWVKRCSRKSLRVLGSVGEPINPEVWNWYSRVVGDSHCPIVDTWWQTETGGILISPSAKGGRQVPGSATLALPGIQAVVLDSKGQELEGACEGLLCLSGSWPGQARTIYKDHKRFQETYFSAYPGYYFTGDGCRRDAEGNLWITGRVDDVINVSGHRLGTAEIESAIVTHPAVAEAAVVGRPHEIKGQGVYAYVTLKNGYSPQDSLKAELNAVLRKEIGPIASLDWIQWAPSLPKTRSGKIMRRILRKLAEGEFEALGDISTLADPACVQELKSNRVS